MLQMFLAVSGATQARGDLITLQKTGLTYMPGRYPANIRKMQGGVEINFISSVRQTVRGLKAYKPGRKPDWLALCEGRDDDERAREI
jgi:hypothetical protein